MTTTPLHLTPEQVQDPVGAYAAFREQAELPQVVLPGLETPVRLVTRYADVKAALTEPRLIRDRTSIATVRAESDPQDELLAAAFDAFPAEYAKYLSGHLALFDGEEHARRRAPLTRAFTARRIAALREFVERTAAELLAELADRDRPADLLAAFAYPLSTRVICEVVGVEAEDRTRVCDWIRDLAYGDGSGVVDGLVGIVDYVKGLIGRRRAEPTEDLISALVHGTREGEEPLDEDDLVSIVILLINTGITPPALFLAHGLLALFDQASTRAAPRIPHWSPPTAGPSTSTSSTCRGARRRRSRSPSTTTPTSTCTPTGSGGCGSTSRPRWCCGAPGTPSSWRRVRGPTSA
ncbi:cytochrome P450 [Streptomyces sp. CBMA123]|uniref:cytochrome P450 n=1 Tax=Streptomyces sp. CBMA123 TaxID=1896313 RepID=UPI001CB83A27|nr:cytochrome P450 [Streptomyces sp. CBMA123]